MQLNETGDSPSTSFVMDNVSELLPSDSPTYKERRDIPAGVYNVQVINVIGKEYYDKTDCFDDDTNNPHPNAIVKRLIPLEVMDGEYAGERALLSVYIQPDKAKCDPKTYTKYMVKFNMGRETMAMLAHASGLSSITDLDDCAGKFLKATLVDGKPYKGKVYVNVKKLEPLGGTTEAKPVITPPRVEPMQAPVQPTSQEVEQELKKDIMF
jgi:hypothetical protein